ncbi:hypothetical protein [Kineosporia sp. NBRC 101731]|uniref:hypothetical protein n=1 Tax=Kineosporia sp. NBRC 101731 TaxID=3032199 RepID=UPI002554A268|nr:hypothetical protein [Kineosporia sp. NBRC 101731]
MSDPMKAASWWTVEIPDGASKVHVTLKFGWGDGDLSFLASASHATRLGEKLIAAGKALEQRVEEAMQDREN